MSTSSLLVKKSIIAYKTTNTALAQDMNMNMSAKTFFLALLKLMFITLSDEITSLRMRSIKMATGIRIRPTKRKEPVIEVNAYLPSMSAASICITPVSSKTDIAKHNAVIALGMIRLGILSACTAPAPLRSV